VDSSAGLLALRERQPLTIFATQATLDAIDANRMFDVVDRAVAPRRAVRLGEPFEPLPGIKLEMFAVPGKVPLWLEEGKVAIDEIGEETVAVAVEAAGKRLVYAPACARVTEDLHARIANADVLFFDGTLFADDEMIVGGLGDKTGKRMGHSPVSGPGGTLEALARHTRTRRILIHINNSNPILIEGSPEEAKVKSADWEIAFDGMEVIP
jgi:pyrroloquinoline quinone biosynthesis protein B